MNLIKKIGVALILASVCIACELEEVEPQTTKPFSERPVDIELIVPEEVDMTFFEHIQGMGEVYAKNDFYTGYNFTELPSYIIYLTESGAVERGFVINPQTDIPGAIKLDEEMSMGLNVYRFDDQMDAALARLESGNGYYTFDYSINGESYYLQKYTDKDVSNYNAIDFMTHEMFHKFQFDIWDYRSNWTQDEDNYPFTQELLELQILVSEIFKELPNIDDKEVLWDKLTQYVAIRTREIEIDPSDKKLILNMELEQERIEGGAEYIEIMGARENFIDRSDQTFLFFPGYAPLEQHFNSFADVKSYFASSIFYDTGASALYCIYQTCREELDKIVSETPYGIASKTMKLTPEQVDQAIERAKSSVDWAAIQKKASKLMELKNGSGKSSEYNTPVRHSDNKIQLEQKYPNEFYDLMKQN